MKRLTPCSATSTGSCACGIPMGWPRSTGWPDCPGARSRRPRFGPSLWTPPSPVGSATSSGARVAEDLAEVCGSEAGAQGLVSGWTALTGRVDTAVLEILTAVRSRVPVVLVSNATTRLEADLTALGLADAFDAVVNSARTGFHQTRSPGLRGRGGSGGSEAAAVPVHRRHARTRRCGTGGRADRNPLHACRSAEECHRSPVAGALERRRPAHSCCRMGSRALRAG